MSQAPGPIYAVNGPQPANMSVHFAPQNLDLPSAAAKRANELLQLYIIDYCEKRNFRAAADALRREANVGPEQKAPVDSNEGLLYEWWTCFWEVYTARVHPDRAHSKVAKEYSDNLHQSKISSHQGQGQPPNQRLAGPSRPYVNGASAGHAPPAVNGHGPSVQYVNVPTGPPNPAGPMSGNSGVNPTPLHNPQLQHLQQPRQVNGRPFAGPTIPGSQPGGPQPVPPGAQMQGRMIQNGAPAQANPIFRQIAGSSPQNQDAHSSPRNPNPSDNANPPPPEGSDPTRLSDNQKTTPRSRAANRKRGPEEESPPKGETPPERKRQKKSPQENGAPLPGTPSLASAQPVGNGRAPPSGYQQPFLPNKMGPPGPGMPSFSPHPGPVGAPPVGPPGAPLNRPPSASAVISNGHPALLGQLRELEAYTQRTQTDQQHFQLMQEQAITAYAKHPYMNAPGGGPSMPGGNPSTDPNGQPPRPPTVGATSASKGAMLPPPPPNMPPTPNNNMTPTMKAPPVNGLLPPAPTVMKDGSPKIDGVSPENTRPGSRPIPSTPQQIPSAPTPTGIASTPGGPSMSAPSPAQLATPQQNSRPQSQSPNARPTTAGIGGMGNTTAPNPSAMLARTFGSGPPGPGGPPGNPNPTMTPSSMTNGPMTSASSFGGAGSGMSNDSSTDEFLELTLGQPFDLQMMGFQDSGFDPMSFTMMDDFTGFLQDSSLDSLS